MFLVVLIIIVLTTGTSVGLNLGGLIGCKKDISVDFIQQCPEPNMAVSFKEIFVLQINKNQYAFSGKIEFLEPVGEPWKLKFQLHKCKSKDNSKSCQDFFRFDIDRICQKLPQKNQVWSRFVEDMHLDTKCPLQPKVYPIENIVIDAGAMKYFPISNAYYKLKIEGYMNATKIICVDIAFILGCKK